MGTIEVGKKADLAVLDQNILTCDPKKISDSTVRYTISDGRIVHEASPTTPTARAVPAIGRRTAIAARIRRSPSSKAGHGRRTSLYWEEFR